MPVIYCTITGLSQANRCEALIMEDGLLGVLVSAVLLVLADSGGSNGCRPRVWKKHLQEKLADQFGLTIVVAHYPTGTSKWNPVEHRLFSEISKNWAGEPLRDYDTLLNFARKTTTTSGLTVEAYRDTNVYTKGQRDRLRKATNACPPENTYAIGLSAKLTLYHVRQHVRNIFFPQVGAQLNLDDAQGMAGAILQAMHAAGRENNAFTGVDIEQRTIGAHGAVPSSTIQCSVRW